MLLVLYVFSWLQPYPSPTSPRPTWSSWCISTQKPIFLHTFIISKYILSHVGLGDVFGEGYGWNHKSTYKINKYGLKEKLNCTTTLSRFCEVVKLLKNNLNWNSLASKYPTRHFLKPFGTILEKVSTFVIPHFYCKKCWTSWGCTRHCGRRGWSDWVKIVNLPTKLKCIAFKMSK